VKLAFFVLRVFLLCSFASADEVPIAIGSGSDTVWFKTGINLAANANSVVVPNYGAIITYAPDKTVESILLSPLFPSTAAKYTLHGVGLNGAKRDIVNKLGKPAKEFSKEKDEVFDAYQSVWVFKDQLLVVGFWQTDQVTPDKHAKDSVAWVILRRAHF
jgi:hypothetical protein